MYQILDLLSKQKLKYFRYLKQKFYDELVMSTPKRKKKTMMTITLMIASTTLPDTLPDLPWLKTASNMKMTKR